MPARRSLALFLSLFALLPAACGGGEDTVDNPGDDDSAGQAEEDAGSSGTSAQGTVEIVIKDFKFDPDTAQVKVGQVVSWRNEDDAEHDAFSEKDGLDTDDIGKGETTEFTPEKAGTIEYICSIHPNMKATLEIADQ